MDKRRIAAIIEVDAVVAFKKTNEKPVPYLKKALSQIEGVSVEDTFILEEDETKKWPAYLSYLIEWAFIREGELSAGNSPIHEGELSAGNSPICYEKFCENECPLGGDSTNDCEGCADSCDYHCVNGECVLREIEG